MSTLCSTRRRCRLIAAGVLVVLAGTVGAVGAARYYAGSVRMAAALLGIRAAFRQVQQLSTGELASWRADARRPPLLIIDVREPAEFAISHLADARNVPWGSDWQQALKDTPKDQAIVVYCSIGYRSSVAARQLQQAGFAQVANLEGSIFKWASEGRPLQGADGAAATRVHPYDATWGLLLAPQLRAPLP
jgi:rhodanese-related sulfurtransferase